MSDYLIEEQYEYAKKTGDWESGKVLTHGQALNDNQQIVLEWLKEKTCKCNKPVYPMNLVRKAVEKMPVEIVNYYDHLSDREEFQVLAAFAQWGLEQEE